MNCERYPVQNYVPINPSKKFEHEFEHDLDTTLQKMTFTKIVNDPDYHFKNSYITNFDLIHHECRGDDLSHTRKYYETIYKKDINEQIDSNDCRYRFISSAIKSQRKDVSFEKGIFNEHFNRDMLEKKLEKKGVFLSSMKRRAFNKKNKKTTDDCKSLMF